MQLHNSIAISDEMKNLEKEGFGKIFNKEVHAKIKKEMFAKPHPDTLSDDSPVLVSLQMSVQAYREKFNAVRLVSSQAAELLLRFHPQHELMTDLFTPDQQMSSSEN